MYNLIQLFHQKVSQLIIIVISFSILVLSLQAQAADTIPTCYTKVLSSVMTLGHLPTESDVASAMQQCDGTFDDVEALVEQCHQDKVNFYVSQFRAPTSAEMEQAITECSALVQETVDELIPDPCAEGPSGFENLIPAEYAALYASGDPQFLEIFNSICQEQAEQIKSSIIGDIASDYEKAAQQQYQDAVDAATANNWLISADGVEINYLNDSGIPIYYTTNESNLRNLTEATLAGTDKLWSTYTGQGLTLGLWDAGSISENHVEYINRIFWKDNETSAINYHPTHIAGTLIATGNINPEAKGMAPDATIDAYNWKNAISELFTAAATGATSSGLLISNHSYGIVSGWSYYQAGIKGHTDINWSWGGLDCSSFDFCNDQEDYKNGLYNKNAYELDYVSYLSPYHLIVKSAGNNSAEGPEPGTKHIAWSWNESSNSWSQIESSKTRAKDCGHDNGYDCLSPDSTAKNILTVGSVDKDRVISSFSSRGPTDDWRIKPDIVAKGQDVTSTWTDGGYKDISGTSMSTPVVSGSLLLLQQKYKSLHQEKAMRASTLKALAIHTADDVAPAGPDYIYGWGILNSQRASALLDENNATHQILEQRLNNTGTYSLNFIAQSAQPLVVTLVWTDPPKFQPGDKLDPSDIMLANDLDLRISNNGISFYPWKMNLTDPSAAAGNGDNIRDNVEQIVVKNPIIGETYQIKVNHKSTLIPNDIMTRESCGDNDTDETQHKNHHQCFSLVISQTESGIINDVLSPAQAEQTTSGLINLYIPAVNYLNQTYSANLEMITNISPMQFKLVSFSQRSSTTDSNVSILDTSSLNLMIPEIMYGGKLWQVNLTRDTNSESLKWILGEIKEASSE